LDVEVRKNLGLFDRIIRLMAGVFALGLVVTQTVMGVLAAVLGAAGIVLIATAFYAH